MANNPTNPTAASMSVPGSGTATKTRSSIWKPNMPLFGNALRNSAVAIGTSDVNPRNPNSLAPPKSPGDPSVCVITPSDWPVVVHFEGFQRTLTRHRPLGGPDNLLSGSRSDRRATRSRRLLLPRTCPIRNAVPNSSAIGRLGTPVRREPDFDACRSASLRFFDGCKG